MTFTAGSKLRASDLNNLPYGALVGGYVAAGAANVVSAGSPTTETDLGSRAQSNSITFTNGHTYVALLTVNANVSAAGSAWPFRLRLVNPVGGAGSILYGGTNTFMQLQPVNSGFDLTQSGAFIYVATSTFSSKVYTSYYRAAGTGTINIYGGSGLNLTVLDYSATSMVQT